jgi:hypothetical protein
MSGRRTHGLACVASLLAARSPPGRPVPAAPRDVDRVGARPPVTAEMAGISRVVGGYHIQADNVAGLEMGRRIAEHSWPRYQAYFDGTAVPRD